MTVATASYVPSVTEVSAELSPAAVLLQGAES